MDNGDVSACRETKMEIENLDIADISWFGFRALTFVFLFIFTVIFSLFISHSVARPFGYTWLLFAIRAVYSFGCLYLIWCSNGVCVCVPVNDASLLVDWL